MVKFWQRASRIGTRPMRYQVDICIEGLSISDTTLDNESALSVVFQRGPKLAVTKEEAFVISGKATWNKSLVLSMICTLYVDKINQVQTKGGKLIVRRRVWSARKGTHHIGIGLVEFNIGDYVGIQDKKEMFIFPLKKCSDINATLTGTIQTIWMKEMQTDEDTMSSLSMDSTASVQVCVFGNGSNEQELYDNDNFRIEEHSGGSGDTDLLREEDDGITNLPYALGKKKIRSKTSIDEKSTMSKTLRSRSLYNIFEKEQDQKDITFLPKALNISAKPLISTPKKAPLLGNPFAKETPPSVDAMSVSPTRILVLQKENNELMKELIKTKLECAEVHMKCDEYQKECFLMQRKIQKFSQHATKMELHGGRRRRRSWMSNILK